MGGVLDSRFQDSVDSSANIAKYISSFKHKKQDNFGDNFSHGFRKHMAMTLTKSIQMLESAVPGDCETDKTRRSDLGKAN